MSATFCNIDVTSRDNQHGFVKYKACVTNLLETIDYLTSIMTSKVKSFVDMIYLDFEKAFDKVPHMRLLHKLNGYGIKGNILKWIEIFFNWASTTCSVG